MTYDRELRTEAAHALTHNQEVWSDRGYAVVTAGGLSEGDTDFELDVGPYDVLVGDTDETSVGPTTLSVNAPDSDPYWLVVYVDGEGLQTEQGPEGEVFVGDQSVVASNADVREITSPAPPTLADIGPVTILGKVLVTSSGVTNSLIDDRVFQSERVFETIDANAVTTEEINNNNGQTIYAGNQSGSDAETRLTNAISAASDGDRIFLESTLYESDRTIDKRIVLVANYSGLGSEGGNVHNSTWTITSRVRAIGVGVTGSAPGEIIIDADRCSLFQIGGGGNVIFNSGTEQGIIDGGFEGVSVTDNGNNTVGDLG